MAIGGLEKPKLFVDKKSMGVFFLTLFILIAIRLFYLYGGYKEFVSKPFYYTHAEVLTQKAKQARGKTYQVLKLRSQNGLEFYTTSYKNIAYLGKRLRIQMFPSEQITFWEYLGTFFIRTRIKEVQTLPASTLQTLIGKVATQHTDAAIGSFYNAVFFAAPLDEKIRDKVSLFGAAHVVALSGFHLTILWGVIYGILFMLYKPSQQRYFPYRYALLDIGMVTLVLLGFYVWLTDFPPSLLRAYAMVAAGWMALILGIELLSFEFLFAVVFVLLALAPSLIVSLSFWLSVAGVFMILLVIRYSEKLHVYVVGYVAIPVGVFMLMGPIVHGVFGVTSVYQLVSPLLAMAFVPFFPLAIGLHLFGYGDILDGALQWLFSIEGERYDRLLPQPLLWAYIVLALAAIRWSKMFGVLLASASIYTVYLHVF